jgi:hypothetical protein
MTPGGRRALICRGLATLVPAGSASAYFRNRGPIANVARGRGGSLTPTSTSSRTWGSACRAG